MSSSSSSSSFSFNNRGKQKRTQAGVQRGEKKNGKEKGGGGLTAGVVVKKEARKHFCMLLCNYQLHIGGCGKTEGGQPEEEGGGILSPLGSVGGVRGEREGRAAARGVERGMEGGEDIDGFGDGDVREVNGVEELLEEVLTREPSHVGAMYVIELCAAQWCSVLQYVAVRCSVLPCAAVCRSALQCAAVCCSAL